MLVRYDSSPVTGRRLRVWDRLEGDLVERSLRAGQPVKCRTLGLFWVEGPGGKQRGLRLAHDSEGKHLLLTPDEAEKAAEQRAGEEARARAAAERRAKALEKKLAELERRGPGRQSPRARAKRRG